MVVWPAAFDSAKSRSEGRRIAKSHAVQAPRVDELEAAARKLSLDPEVSSGSALPFRWWEKTGHIIVRRADRSRSKILKDLAAEIARARHSKQ